MLSAPPAERPLLCHQQKVWSLGAEDAECHSPSVKCTHVLVSPAVSELCDFELSDGFLILLQPMTLRCTNNYFLPAFFFFLTHLFLSRSGGN